jgi:GNAT superfamily N-acetyltransferase
MSTEAYTEQPNIENSSEQIKLSYEGMSRENFEEALALGKEIFPYDSELLEQNYQLSLDKSDSQWEKYRMLDYYVARDEETGKIVAITGLYNLKNHGEDEVWLGWYGVLPEMRGKGLGKKVLTWSMDKARDLGYKKFRLWTTTFEGEAAAQKLFDSLNIAVYKSEEDKEEGHTTLYREINL